MSKLERIHAGPRHKLYRNDRSDPAVVLKLNATQPASASAGAALRHEFEILRDLKLPGVVTVLGLVDTGSGVALVMQDAGESNLTQHLRSAPLSMAAFLDIALQLAEAVARLHGRSVIHRDIHPGNIVWNSENGVATLCDFAIAMTLPALVMETPDPERPEGTLAYMSPEQTGRTGQSVDWRADLYSLGATFYEMLTGAPPFGEGDAVALVHAQIAREATPPHEINSQVPLALSDIVLRLLEKEPEQRYQTAEALAADLREAKGQWLRSATIEPFPLGSREVPRGLSIPDRLYGRDEELQSLADAFARICAGRREWVLVTGSPGIGKSALVDRLRPSVGDGHGYYAAGKFDQLQRSVPFSGLAQALRRLVLQLLTESETALDRWRQQIEEAVAPNGQLLVAIVPELGHILGPQPVVPEVGPVESTNRFHLVLTRFLRVFAQPEHPLVLFLDDLQWVDAASLQLLEGWVGDAASHHLLVIGAYRDNEVGPSHPLTLSLAGLRHSGGDIYTIHLKPLDSSAIAQLCADTFGEDGARLQFLADLIIRKSAGNPFFVRRLLHLMRAQGLFRFLPDSHHWTWDESEIEHAPISDNVLDLMVLAIDRLPTATKRLLEIGACIGHRFELGTLVELAGCSRTAVAEQLWPAVEDGLLVPVHEMPKPAAHVGAADTGTTIPHPTLQFIHDRVQQAAYNRLSEESRQALHHAIGRRLLELAGDDFDETLFEIVDQLDLGEAHVVDDAERSSLLELNLAAGRKAKASAAYRAAFEYLTVARRHLGARAWDCRPELTFTVHRELAESAYLTGEHATAEELVETALEHASSKVAKAELYSLRVLAATVASDWPRALRWGREGLSVFGLEWPLDGLAGANEAEAAAVMKNLGERKIEDLVDAPEVEDADIRASMHLLSLLGAPAYFSGADVLMFLTSRAVNLSLNYGPSPYSAFAYVLYGGIHNARTGQHDIGYAFGKLALAMLHRFGNRAEACRTLEVYGVLVHHWKAPLRAGLPLLKEGFRAGIESGELAFAAFNLNSVLINALPSGLTLRDLLAEAEVALDFARTQKNRTSTEIALPFRQIARALTGATARPDTFDDQEFDETRFLEEARNHETALGHYWVAKLQLAYFVGDYQSALRYSREAAKRIQAGILGMISCAEHVFYTALTLTATTVSSNDSVASSLAELRALHGQLVMWARHCPENFAHKASLVGAEMARLDRSPGEASVLYRAAIDNAHRQRFIQDEALAHELRARFLLGEHEPAFAAVDIRLARDRYRRWGASVKAAALEQEFPDCFRPDPLTTGWRPSIDEMALIKASQAISVETEPKRVFEQILRVVVEATGAQRGALALASKDAITIHARIEAADEVSVSVAEAPLEQCIDLPSPIFRYVLRTREFLLLPDARAAGMFAHDPVVRQRKVRSVLCIPLVKLSTAVGLVYLENNAMAAAFAEELVETGRVLAAQAVTSLENSRLLKKLQQLTSELEERVADRTQQLTDQIAARDKAEKVLRLTEARRSFLLDLSDVLRAETDASSMGAAGLRLLADQLHLDQCCFTLVHTAEDRIEVAAQHQRGDLPPMPPTLRPSDFPEAFQQVEKSGLIVNDIASDATLSAKDRQLLGALHLIAFIVAFVRKGRRNRTWVLVAGSSRPRVWTPADITLVQEAAERIWSATERARAEDALRESQAQLQRAGHAKDEFLAMLGHELRNPLAPITTTLELMKLRAPDVFVRERESIGTQVRHLTGLVDDLLDVSRIASGKLKLDTGLVEITEIVAASVEVTQPLMEEHRLTLNTDIEDGLTVAGDRRRLVQVIVNLLSNAAKYSPPERNIYVLGTAEAGQAVVRVRDEGNGIDPDLLPHVFESFSQGAQTIDRSRGGLGLGLAIVRSIVALHGGSIGVSSEGANKGSEFTVRLPLFEGRHEDVAPSRAEGAAITVSAAPRTHPIKVLVVDDYPTAADSLALLLQEMGYQTRVARDGVEALQEIKGFAPDVALVDIGLPVIDGYEVAQTVRRMPDREHLPLVAITGYGQASDHARIMQAGFDEHLVKPLQAEGIGKLIESLMADR